MIISFTEDIIFLVSDMLFEEDCWVAVAREDGTDVKLCDWSMSHIEIQSPGGCWSGKRWVNES